MTNEQRESVSDLSELMRNNNEDVDGQKVLFKVLNDLLQHVTTFISLLRPDFSFP
jgi:hypothetical protein